MSKFAQGLSKLKLKEVPTYVQEHAGQHSPVPSHQELTLPKLLRIACLWRYMVYCDQLSLNIVK